MNATTLPQYAATVHPDGFGYIVTKDGSPVGPRYYNEQKAAQIADVLQATEVHLHRKTLGERFADQAQAFGTEGLLLVGVAFAAIVGFAIILN